MSESDPEQTSAIEILSRFMPCLDREGYDSSHGGYHRTARESCRRGLRRGCVSYLFFAPLTLAFAGSSVFGGDCLTANLSTRVRLGVHIHI